MNTIGSAAMKTIGELLRKAFPQLESSANVPARASGASQPVSGVLGFLGNLFKSPGLFGFLATPDRKARYCVVQRLALLPALRR